jgi:hypothetical protein
VLFTLLVLFVVVAVQAGSERNAFPGTFCLQSVTQMLHR